MTVFYCTVHMCTDKQLYSDCHTGRMYARHVSVADGGHRHDRPPEPVRYRLELGLWRASLCSNQVLQL